MELPALQQVARELTGEREGRITWAEFFSKQEWAVPLFKTFLFKIANGQF